MDKKDLKRGSKTSQYKESMDKKDLKKLSKSQLIKLLLKTDSVNKPIPPPRTGKWESIKAKQMVKEYEDIIQPPEQRPPKPTRKPPPPPILQLEEKEHITDVPSSKIKELNRALKGHAKSYGIELQDNLNPLNHFTKTKALVELSMSRQEILNVIDKWVSEGSGWVIDRIDSHYINVTTYQHLHGSSYIELPTNLRNPMKGLINIKNKDDECFRWCHIRHLNPQIKHPERIKKDDK